MKAVYIDEFGGPEVVKTGDLPVPEVKSDQILIKVAAAGVNPVDWKIREGYLANAFDHSMPVVLGWDMAGTIETVGEDVQGFGAGDEIYCFNRMDTIQHGTFAEYSIGNADAVARIPNQMDFYTAATIPLASLTAWQGLVDIASLAAGETLFVDNGSGGVGGFAIQIAKTIGAKVIATAGSKNHDYLKSIGADAVVDYQSTDIQKAIREFASDGVDVVFDCTGREQVEPIFGCVKRGTGRVVTINGLEQSIPVLESCAAKYDVLARMFHVEGDGEALTRVAELIEQGMIRPLPIEAYSLDDAVTALQRSQEGHVRGKLVLSVP
jgi:NADPH2:quinone reductase